MQIGMQLDKNRFRDLIGDKINLGLSLNRLILRVEDHFDVVICRAEREGMRRLRQCACCGQKRQH